MQKECVNKNLGSYHDLYVQSDYLLLADVFEEFRDQCLKIYDLDPAHFFNITTFSMSTLFKSITCAIRFNN